MIRGRVFLADSVIPVAGIVVTAVGPRNSTAGAALTRSTGDYVLQVSNGGTYELRALRIGYRPAVVGGVAVAAGVGDTIVRNIYLTSLPVALTAVDVSGDDDCSLRGRDGQRLLRLWEQARGALAATHLWEQGGALDVRLMTVVGRQDAPSRPTDSLYVEVDTLTVREVIVDRAFAATPPETLIARGYVRTSPDDEPVFDMPNAETLLSDAFIDGHCFAIRKPPAGEDWIGLGFRPRRTIRGVTDIRGVLWLDRSTAELRRIEFEYANLPTGEYRICDLKPHVPLTPDRMGEVPPFKQPQPQCQTARNRNNSLRLGGHADFVRLRTGEWLVANWNLRTPPDQGRIRALPWKHRQVNRRTERCWAGPGCVTVVSMRPRLVTSTGVITAVVRDGELLYENGSGSALLAAASARQASKGLASIEGTVRDSAGRPLVGAIVHSELPGRAVWTDSTGRFRLTLPTGRVTLHVRCRGYESAREAVELTRAGTRDVEFTLRRGTW
ncbi:MAG: carboxypeptidase-like regulatory domain-containing protein [Gemmatimonadaceae bacterium]